MNIRAREDDFGHQPRPIRVREVDDLQGTCGIGAGDVAPDDDGAPDGGDVEIAGLHYVSGHFGRQEFADQCQSHRIGGQE